VTRAAGFQNFGRDAAAIRREMRSAGSGTEIDLSVPGSIAYRKSSRRSRLQLFRKKVG